MIENITLKFAKEVYSLYTDNVVEKSYPIAKLKLLDYLGVTLHGATNLNKNIKKYLNNNLNENGKSKIIGYPGYTTMKNAALLNGMSSHVLELDDGHRFGAIHPGAPVITAILTSAERDSNIKGENVLKGIIIGYELSNRLAMSIQPSHYKKGYHTTATCGVIGAACGIAVSKQLDFDTFLNILSISAVSAFGTLKVLENSSTIKPYNVGRAAVLAIEAVELALSGFVGPEDSLGGINGFVNMTSDSFDNSKLIVNKSKLEIENSYTKLYSSCRHTHSAIEAALTIREQSNLEHKDIKNITIYIYSGLEGKHDHKKIYGSASAKMSIPYSVAIALLTGNANLDEFSDFWIHNKDLIELLDKTNIITKESLTRELPNKRIAIVEIETIDGNTLKNEVSLPKGEPENPLSDNDYFSKFTLLAQKSGFNDSKAKKIINFVLTIENKKMKDLMSIL